MCVLVVGHQEGAAFCVKAQCVCSCCWTPGRRRANRNREAATVRDPRARARASGARVRRARGRGAGVLPLLDDFLEEIMTALFLLPPPPLLLLYFRGEGGFVGVSGGAFDCACVLCD